MGNRYNYKTFKEWCLENNRQDILDLWDYDLNKVDTSEIPCGTKKRYYFKCHNGIHESKEKCIIHITRNSNHKIICEECDYHKDLTGKIYGELTVLYYDKEQTKGTNHRWVCKCSCGNIISILETKLNKGNKLTCGGKYRHKNYINTHDCDITTDIYNPSYMKHLRQCNDYYLYRKQVMEKDGYKCIVCGSHDIEVHHIYPFASYPHDRLDINTGICMCRQHHSTSSPISFHSIYGVHNNTPEQLEEYVNYMRQMIGINDNFDVYSYMNDIESDDIDIDDSMLDLFE